MIVQVENSGTTKAKNAHARLRSLMMQLPLALNASNQNIGTIKGKDVNNVKMALHITKRVISVKHVLKKNLLKETEYAFLARSKLIMKTNQACVLNVQMGAIGMQSQKNVKELR
jgi:hypothetical protein